MVIIILLILLIAVMIYKKCNFLSLVTVAMLGAAGIALIQKYDRSVCMGGQEKKSPRRSPKTLYHGSPYLVDELVPKLPRGSDDFNSQEGIYTSSNKAESALYAMARDKERINKGFGIKDNILYLRKDRWLKEFNEPGKPLHTLNDRGYLYTINTNKYEQNPNIPTEYIIKHHVKPDTREEITHSDISNNIKYVTKEEMINIFAE